MSELEKAMKRAVAAMKRAVAEAAILEAMETPGLKKAIAASLRRRKHSDPNFGAKVALGTGTKKPRLLPRSTSGGARKKRQTGKRRRSLRNKRRSSRKQRKQQKQKQMH
jgi:hypothetical protein